MADGLSTGLGLQYRIPDYTKQYAGEERAQAAAKQKRSDKEQAQYDKLANNVFSDKSMYHKLDWDKSDENAKEIVNRMYELKTQYPDNYMAHIQNDPKLIELNQEDKRLKTNKKYLEQTSATLKSLGNNATPEQQKIAGYIDAGDYNSLKNFKDDWGNTQVTFDKSGTPLFGVTSIGKTKIPEVMEKVVNDKNYQTLLSEAKNIDFSKLNVPKGMQEYIQKFGIPTDSQARDIEKAQGLPKNSLHSVEGQINQYVQDHPEEFHRIENSLRDSQLADGTQEQKDYLALDENGRKKKLPELAVKQFTPLAGEKIKTKDVAPFKQTESEKKSGLRVNGNTATIGDLSIRYYTDGNKEIFTPRPIKGGYNKPDNFIDDNGNQIKGCVTNVVIEKGKPPIINVATESDMRLDYTDNAGEKKTRFYKAGENVPVSNIKDNVANIDALGFNPYEMRKAITGSLNSPSKAGEGKTVIKQSTGKVTSPKQGQTTTPKSNISQDDYAKLKKGDKFFWDGVEHTKE